MTLEQFYEAYPQQHMKVNGADFAYRYHKNENAKATLVLLTGGLGFSDLFYRHFHRFAQDFSAITFDYLEAYPTMADLADAASVLFERLGVKVWLVGQSLGGVAAQIFTKRHPDFISGLVLSNTASLAEDLDGEGLECLENMIARQKKSRRMIKLIPFGIVKKFMLDAVKKKAEKLPEESRESMSEMAGIMFKMLTKRYELHMIDMLADCGNHLNMKKSDFEQLNDKVLLILSDDDETFNSAVKKSLIKLMTNPTVITDMGGGHLGALMNIDEYAKTVSDYISRRV